jgi:hypothetical protein
VTAVPIVDRDGMSRRMLLLLLLWQQSFLFALFSHVADAHAAVSRTLGMVNHAPSIKGKNTHTRVTVEAFHVIIIFHWNGGDFFFSIQLVSNYFGSFRPLFF